MKADNFKSIAACMALVLIYGAMTTSDDVSEASAQQAYCRRIQDAIQASPSRNWPEARAAYKAHCGERP